MITPEEALAYRSTEDVVARAAHEERVDKELEAYHGAPVRVEMANLPPKVAIDLETTYGERWKIEKNSGSQLGPATWTFTAKGAR